MAENNFYYRLTLNRLSRFKITQDGKITGYWLSSTQLHVLQFNETYSFILKKDGAADDTELILHTLKIHKRIGCHNTIEMRMQMIHTVGDYGLIQLNDVMDYFSDMSVQLEYSPDGASYFNVAENYFVMGVKPHIKSKSSSGSDTTYTIDLSLSLASWDVIMDKTAYSRAYTGKRLSSDILYGMMTSYDMSTGSVCLLNTLSSDMRVLLVSIDDETKVELRLPYLVQYNETDYNFLLRNANRCGEFLYFEHGVLNLGLKKILVNGIELIRTISDYNSLESVENYDAWLEPEKYSYNPLDEKFAKVGDKCKPYVSEFANDDFFELLPKDGYDSVEGWKNVLGPIWSQQVGELLQYEDLSILALKNAVSGIMFESMSHLKAKGNNKQYNKTYFSKTSQKQSSYDEKENMYSPFADFYTQKTGEGDEAEIIQSKSGNIPSDNRPDSMLYFNKQKAERKAALKQYKLVFDHCQKDIQLGDVVAVDEIKSKASFVVVDICSYSKVENESSSNSMEVTIMPIDLNNPVPLPADVELVRKSGAQSAVVVDSNDPKRLGRVRVRYHWQGENDDATPWIRIAVPFASDDDSGTFSTLNPGDEVMVDYENGNIERPYVVGSLYNRANQPPFGQRKYSQIIRSRNGHMIGFQDPTNASSIYKSVLPGLVGYFSYIPAVSGLTEFAKSQDENRGVMRAMGGIDITDAYGIYSISMSSDSRKIDISSPFGTVNLDAAMGISISAPNGDVTIKGKNVTIEAGNNLTLKSGTNIENDLIEVIKSKDNLIEFGKKEAKMAAGGIAYTFFDFKALRFIADLLIKPVSGTLKVHSGRYLMLESGEGKARIPAHANKWIDKNMDSKIKLTLLDAECWKFYVESFKALHREAFKKLCGRRSSMERDVQNNQNLEFKANKEYYDLISKLINSDSNMLNSTIDNYIRISVRKGARARERYKEGRAEEVAKLKNKVLDFQKEVAEFRNGPRKEKLRVVDNTWYEIAKEVLDLEEGKDYNNFVNIGNDYNFLYKDNEVIRKVIRKGIHHILDARKIKYESNGVEIASLDSYTEENWKKLVKSILKSNSSPISPINFKNTAIQLTNKLDWPIDIKSSLSWTAGAKPCILLSEEKDKTLGIGGEEYKSCKPSLVELIECISI